MTNSNDVIQIDTPENVTFDYDVAGIGSRFLAALADTAIIAALQVVIFFAFMIFISGQYGASDDSATWGIVIMGILSFILLWGYYVFFEFLWNGQSPGKRMVGLRVIRVDGTPISEIESIIRNLVRLIDFMPFAYGVGVVTMFVNSSSRRVGDLAAGTVVVHDRQAKGLHELAPVKQSSLAALGIDSDIPEGFPIEKLTQREMQVIEELVDRWNALSNRQALARHILTSIVKRLDIPKETVRMEKADRILAAIYRADRARGAE